MPKRFGNLNRGRAGNQRPAAPGNRKPPQHGQTSKNIAGPNPNRHVQPLLGPGSGSNRDHQPDRKRPSVFDRLGTKRINVNQGPRSSSFEREQDSGMSKGKPFRNTGGGHSSTSASRNDSSSNRPSSSTNRRDREEYEKDVNTQRRPRSRSPSPRNNRNPGPSSTPRKDDSKSSSLLQRHSRVDKSTGKGHGHGESSGTKSHDTKFHGDKAKTKDSFRSEKSGQKSSNKSKDRPSNSSQGTSSRSSSSSQSTSSTGSSSSSSSSESSAPSIKLKPEKKTKSSSSKPKSSQVKEVQGSSKGRGQPATESSPGSGGSSYAAKHPDGSSSRPSPGPRGHRKDHDFPDQRQPKSEQQPPMERLMDSYRRSRERDRQPSRITERPRSNSRMRMDEPGRKRRLSGESFESAGKRSRLRSPSPSSKYKSVAHKNTSSPHRNESPFVRDKNRAPSRDRIRLVPPSPKHPPYDDSSARHDIRGRDPGLRYMNSPRPNKDLDRERPFSASSFGTAGSNSPGFNRDRDRDEKRPRERLAPARPLASLIRDRISPPPNRERDRPPPLHDFEPLRRAPLLPFPLLPDHGRNQQLQRRRPIDEPRRNLPPAAPARPRSPMIVKTKEALIEKYEDMNKKSRVDLWVDETVRGNRRPGSDTGITPKPLPLLPPRRGSNIDLDRNIIKREKEFTETSTKSGVDENPQSTVTVVPETIVKTEPGPGPAFEPLEEVLSEISDDDDEILTKEVEKVESTVEPEPETEVTTTKADDRDKLSEKDSDVANAKVTSSDNTIGEDPPDSKSVKSEVTLMPPPTETTGMRDREMQSHTQSHSQTDDDILEQMDFEEISDDELDNHPETNKIGIVDALGVDWSSLVCREKMQHSSEVDDVTTSFERVRVKERWTPANVFKQIGLSRSLVSEKLFQKILGKVNEMETRCGTQEKTTEEELENPLLRRRRLERKNCLEKYGLGPASRALSARRDLSLRDRWLRVSKPFLPLTVHAINITCERKDRFRDSDPSPIFARFAAQTIGFFGIESIFLIVLLAESRSNT